MKFNVYWRTALLVALLLLVANVIFLIWPDLSNVDRWNHDSPLTQTLSGLNFDSRSKDPELSAVKLKALNSPGAEDPRTLLISFRMKAYSLVGYPNVFQTAPANEGIRVELASPSDLALLPNYRSGGQLITPLYYLTRKLQLNQWYRVRITVTLENHLVIYLDDTLVSDTLINSENKVSWDLSQITIGRGFDASRKFDGAIADFSFESQSFVPRKHLKAIRQVAHVVNDITALGPFVILLLMFLYRRASLQRFAENRLLHWLMSFLITALCAFSAWQLLQGHTGLLRRYDSLCYDWGALAVIIAIWGMFQFKLNKGAYAVLLIPLMILAAGKIFAAIAVVTFILASWGVGLGLQKQFALVEETAIETDLIAFFLGLCANGFIVWGAMHAKINYGVTHYILFLSEIVFFRKQLLNKYKVFRNQLHSYRFSWGQWAVILYSVYITMFALIHLYDWDDLVAHLYIPKVVALFGYYHYDPFFVYSLDQAIFPKSSYTSLYLMGGEFAVRLFVCFVFFAGDFLLERFVRSKFGERVALFAVLIILFIPFRIWQTSTVFIDNFAYFPAVVLLVRFWATFQQPTRKNLLFFFALFPLAYLSKQQNVFVLIPMAGFCWTLALYATVKNKDDARLGQVVLASGLSVLILSPVLVHNFIIAQNPFFPYFNAIFKSPFFALGEPGVKISMPHSWNVWKLLHDTAFNGSDFKYVIADQSAFGLWYFIWFLFAPVILIVSPKKTTKIAAILFGVFLCACILWLYVLTGPIARYFITCAPIGAILLAFTMDGLLALVEKQAFLYRLNASLLVVFFAVGFTQQSQFVLVPRYPIIEALVTKPKTMSLCMPREAHYTKFFDHVNAQYDKHSKGLIFYSASLYFANFNIETDDWYNYSNLIDIGKASDPAVLYDWVFRKKKFTFIILTKDRPASNLDLLVNGGWIVPQYSEDDFTLYLPKSQV